MRKPPSLLHLWQRMRPLAVVGSEVLRFREKGDARVAHRDGERACLGSRCAGRCWGCLELDVLEAGGTMVRLGEPSLLLAVAGHESLRRGVFESRG